MNKNINISAIDKDADIVFKMDPHEDEDGNILYTYIRMSELSAIYFNADQDLEDNLRPYRLMLKDGTEYDMSLIDYKNLCKFIDNSNRLKVIDISVDED